MWSKTHDKTLKISIIVLALVAVFVTFKIELDAQREFYATTQEDQQYLEKKPLYDCILAAAAMAKESTTDVDLQAAVDLRDACYMKYVD